MRTWLRACMAILLLVAGCQKPPEGVFKNSDYIFGFKSEQSFDFRKNSTVYCTTLLSELPPESAAGSYEMVDDMIIAVVRP